MHQIEFRQLVYRKRFTHSLQPYLQQMQRLCNSSNSYIRSPNYFNRAILVFLDGEIFLRGIKKVPDG